MQKLTLLGKELKEVLHKKWPESEDRLLHLIHEIKRLPPSIASTETDEQELAEEPIQELKLEEPPVQDPKTLPLLYASEKMQTLQEKLEMFALLIEKGQYLKAALISKDIHAEIENFDPTLYFPKIFAKYFQLLIQHVSYLTDEWDKDKTLQ